MALGREVSMLSSDGMFRLISTMFRQTPHTRISKRAFIQPPQQTYTKLCKAFDSGTVERVSKKGSVLLGAGAFALLLYQIYRENVQEPVIDKSVLRDDRFANQKLNVVDALTLKSTGHEMTSGRSRGHKVMHAHEDEEHKYYYYKEPFSREGLLKEFIIGVLGRDMFGEKFPRVLAVETATNDLDDDSRYGIISESLSEKGGNKNLEDWAQLYAEDNINFVPLNLGVSIAFDMLFGKSDCKLANLIVEKSTGECYSIDHESGFDMPPTFVTDEMSALEFICEYRKKTSSEHAIEQQFEGVVDTQVDNLHQPLKGEIQIKNKIAPVLLQAIKNDINNGKVTEFYEKFVSLSDADFKNIYARFGSLFHAEERNQYLKLMQARQAATRAFLAEHQATNENDKSYMNSLWRMSI